MIILIDQDGVSADYSALLYQRWQERFPKEFDRYHVPLDQIPYDITEYYEGEVKAHLKAIEREPGFFESLPPVPGAIDALHELVSLGHNVCICTRPSKRIMEICALEKFRWVSKHLGDIFTERMMVVRDKTFAHGDILIDDKPVITGQCEPSWTHILYDQPYNRHLDQPRISWDTNWRDTIEELEEACYV